MDNSKHSLKFQVRLETCVLNEVTVPSQYSFTMQTERNQGYEQADSCISTPWKGPKGNTIRFGCFLRIKLQDFRQSYKCCLHLYSRSDGHSNLVGSVTMTVSNSRCDKIRKYTIRNEADVKGTIQASLFLKSSENSMISLDRLSSGIISQSNYSTISRQQASLDVDSLIGHLKSQEYETNSEIPQQSAETSHKKLKISKEVQENVGKHEFEAKDAQNLLLKLFEQISKTDAIIGKKQAELNERDIQIKHIKMKELIYKKDEVKLKRLKKQTQFLLAANDILGSKDTKYEQQYSNMRNQKKHMAQIMQQITSDSIFKIQGLKIKLQNAKKHLLNRQKKVKSLQNQLDLYITQKSLMQIENKEKHRIINNIKLQLNNQIINQQDHQADFDNKHVDNIILIEQAKNKEKGLNKLIIKQNMRDKSRSLPSFKFQFKERLKHNNKANKDITLSGQILENPTILSFLCGISTDK